MYFFNPLKKYQYQQTLATSIYGDVCLYEHKKTREKVVIKSSDVRSAKEGRDIRYSRSTCEDIFRERRLLKQFSRFNHPHILQLHKCFQYRNRLYFVVAYCERGDLYERVADGDELSGAEIQHAFSQLVSGIHFLHQNGYAHGDISLENILLNEQNHYQLCDFGLASSLTEYRTEASGKLLYLAPEIVQQHAYLPGQADMWSMGIVLLILFTRVAPFEVASDLDEQFQYFEQYGLDKFLTARQITREIPHDALDLISRLLVISPQERMGLNELINHPWVIAQYIHSIEEDTVRPTPFSKRISNAFKALFRAKDRPTEISSRPIASTVAA